MNPSTPLRVTASVAASASRMTEKLEDYETAKIVALGTAELLDIRQQILFALSFNSPALCNVAIFLLQQNTSVPIATTHFHTIT